MLIGAAIMPATAAQKKHVDQKLIEEIAFLDAWTAVAGAKCTQNKVMFTVAYGKVSAFLDTLGEDDFAKEIVAMALYIAKLKKSADEEIASDGLDAYCNAQAAGILALKLTD